MKNILLLIAAFTAFGLSAQTGHNASGTDTQSKVKQKGKDYDVNLSVSSEEARYKFGEDSLYKYIYAKLYSSPEFSANAKDGHVLISFEINYDGKVMNSGIIEGMGTEIDGVIKKAIIGMKDFLPAKQNGIDYRSEMILDIPVSGRGVEK